MILYSVLPIYTPEEEPLSYVEVEYKGHHILACETEQGYVLERVFSSNPSDYTNEELMPGTVLEQQAVNKMIQ